MQPQRHHVLPNFGWFFLQKRREKSTIVLVSIVILFVACHSYRLALKVYELAHPADVVQDHFNACFYLGR